MQPELFWVCILQNKENTPSLPTLTVGKKTEGDVAHPQ
jgi:hypothetical protein